MSLQLILGSSGAGKSHRMYTEVIEKSIAEPEKSFIIIVPEQFTMETQKDIVSMHPKKGTMNIDIVSFGRLAFRVFEEAGIETTEVLDDMGKILVLRKVIEDKKKQLCLYQKKINMPGFVLEMKSMISEILQYGMGGKDLEDILRLSTQKPALHAKMTDVSLIFAAFEEYLQDRYITTEEVLALLCRYIGNSVYIRDTSIYVDGFTGFTPLQYRVLALLMKYGERVSVSVTVPDSRGGIDAIKPHNIFYLSKKTIDNLEKIASQQGIQIERIAVNKDSVPYRFRKSESLAYLERNLFHFQGEKPYEKVPSISISLCKTPHKEAEGIAGKIFELIRDQGYRYRDIAVVTGDVGSCYRAFEEVFTNNGIPFFLDYKKGLNTNPLIEGVKGILEILEKRFTYESVFRYLRSGMTNLAPETVDQMENYVLARGIRGVKAWEGDWDLPEEILEAKNNFLRPLSGLHETWKNKENTVRDKLKALYEYMVGQQMASKILQMGQELDRSGKEGLALEYEQVYGLFVELLDKLAALLGDEYLNLKELRAILESGFGEMKVGIIPPTIDRVVIGDIERTRLSHVKVLFLAGVNDGIIPKAASGGGILSEAEREFLAINHFELSPTARENSFIQKLYLYLNLTKPEDSIYISYAKMSSDLASLRPSYLIREIRKLFPSIPFRDEEEQDDLVKKVISRYAGLSCLSEKIGNYREHELEPAAGELYSLFREMEGTGEMAAKLARAAFHSNGETQLEKAVAAALYGGGGSVSRLEKYASCAYSHFLSYGLALAERKEYSVEAVDMGNLYHQALEAFSNRLSESEHDFRSMPDAFRDFLVHECVRDVTAGYGNTVLLSSARNAYIIRRVERITARTVWIIQEQIKRGKFSPEYFELSFQNGRIDRVDVYEEDGNRYLRVIDYKSGTKSFSITDAYYHLQMQLLIYMGVVCGLEEKKHPDKKNIPAAVCYYHIEDPILLKGEDVLEKTRMNGLVNASEAVMGAMELDPKGKAVMKTAKGNEISQEDFLRLLTYEQEQAAALNQRIREGDIRVNPYRKGNDTPCRYCPYKSVCGFDTKNPSFGYRYLDKLDTEEIWKDIRKEADSHGDEMDRQTETGN
ncbi:PD-(D/E)XK nuclease family protein [Parasporobacterium paucivorans]|uniref:DNA helicase/exodeoxyribonuclease V, subunit B n=1 Tax=Parasporobacterium paucivorans DSM 15970 TaxID=1122934 RepID=A0A1M6CAZ2_9FIRM|nr:PD-(D/E)XK nuclease family protein [Parasporobacterium paucivorans]SHI58167.1 DNA helicase/exodeoxyribonuclease V, subunit B [Parasporobacterium paucivorans DSM 15970]